MKIGLTTYSLSRLVSKGEFTLCDIIRWGAENGAEHIEIAPGKECLAENAALCAEIRKTASDCGVDLSSYTIGANFIQPDEEAFRKEIERVKREVDVAARLGVTRMRQPRQPAGILMPICRNSPKPVPRLPIMQNRSALQPVWKITDIMYREASGCRDSFMRSAERTSARLLTSATSSAWMRIPFPP